MALRPYTQRDWPQVRRAIALERLSGQPVPPRGARPAHAPHNPAMADRTRAWIALAEELEAERQPKPKD